MLYGARSAGRGKRQSTQMNPLSEPGDYLCMYIAHQPIMIAATLKTISATPATAPRPRDGLARSPYQLETQLRVS